MNGGKKNTEAKTASIKVCVLFLSFQVQVETVGHSLPEGSEPGAQKGPLQEEPPLFPHCVGGNGLECPGSRPNAAQCGRSANWRWLTAPTAGRKRERKDGVKHLAPVWFINMLHSGRWAHAFVSPPGVALRARMRNCRVWPASCLTTWENGKEMEKLFQTTTVQWTNGLLFLFSLFCMLPMRI